MSQEEFKPPISKRQRNIQKKWGGEEEHREEHDTNDELNHSNKSVALATKSTEHFSDWDGHWDLDTKQ